MPSCTEEVRRRGSRLGNGANETETETDGVDALRGTGGGRRRRMPRGLLGSLWVCVLSSGSEEVSEVRVDDIEGSIAYEEDVSDVEGDS
jgi:hypothetical protein